MGVCTQECMCVCVYVHVCTQMNAFVGTVVLWRPEVNANCFPLCPLDFLRQGLCPNLEHTDLARLFSKLQGYPACFPSAEITATKYYAHFYRGDGE